MFLVIGVKVWRMMRGLNLDELADNNPKESAKLRHTVILLGCQEGRNEWVEGGLPGACGYVGTVYWGQLRKQVV